ncbi:MAG TPA: prephenate dehydrogenase/arogenate dehydrogenase family protein [Polyangiaceae bacterium]|nr:prephenate dehydrogenase/arogenate dehydrogenase family protein [Polyangiaceae bacterium]
MDVVIVGFGLIGGSLGAAIRQRALGVVTAIDRAEVVESAPARVVADRCVDVADDEAAGAALRRADLVVLATPVCSILAALPAVLAVAPVVTDCGSTKRAIARCAAGQARVGRFVPAHPMAGAPVGGLARARPDLFVGRRWIVCPERSDEDAVAVVEGLARAVGAEVVRMTVVEHDRVVAMTSHVPQILASTLATLGAERGALAGAGPAFLGATERAGGGEAMWRDVFGTNADEIAAALSDVVREVEVVAEGLGRQEPDLEPALRLLARAREQRAR